MKIREIAVWASIACLAGLLLPSEPAAAKPPHAVTGSFTLVGTDTAGANGYCPFPVTIDYINNERITVKTYPDGTEVDTFRGAAFVTVTNDITGKSLSYTISGPGSYTYAPDGSFTIDASGPNLFWTTVANSYPGVPNLNLTHGHIRVSVDAAGLTTSYQLAGRSIDVCVALT